jgi:hypothetical protein
MPRKLEYANLVKTLTVGNTPKGLYSEPMFWMEGSDLEGSNVHFSYGFCKKTGPIHPVEGALVHPYDECLVFAGLDTQDIRYLGADVSIRLGEEQEEYSFDKPTVVVVPAGTPHGPAVIKSLDIPIVHYSFGIAPEYKAEIIPPARLKAKSTGTKYSHLVKPLLTRLKKHRTLDGSETGRPYVVSPTGVMHPRARGAEIGIGPGNGDQLVWLFGDNLEDLPVNFTWGFYSGAGKWHRDGEAHTHPEEEMLVFVGLNPDDINELGAELEMGMGEDMERHIWNKPTVAICPKGFAHLPLITRWVDKPYGFFVICLSGDHDSPWGDKK